MIDEEDHPRMLAACKNLGRRLARMVAGREYSGRLDQELRQELYDFRNRCKGFGIEFPPLTIMAVPRLGAVALYRADLDRLGLRGAVVQFARTHPEASPAEIAAAVLWAWPQIKPTDFVDEGAFVVAHDRQKQLKANTAAAVERPVDAGMASGEPWDRATDISRAHAQPNS